MVASQKSKIKVVEKVIKAYLSRMERSYKKELRRINYKKVGRPYKFPKSFIEFSALIKVLFSLTYRELSAIIELITHIKISKTQLHKRLNKIKLDLDIRQLLKEELTLIVDSTGFKPYQRGDWRIIKHENGIIKERNGYIKVSAVVDEKGIILSLVVGDSTLHDVEMFEEHLNDLEMFKLKGVKIKALYGDGAYDTYRIYRKLKELGIKPIIRPRKNGVIHYSSVDGHLYTERDAHLKEIKTWGYEKWRSRFEYGKRWIVESVFSALKRRNNELIRSKKLCYIEKEIERMVWVHNLLRIKAMGLSDNSGIIICLIVELADRACKSQFHTHL